MCTHSGDFTANHVGYPEIMQASDTGQIRYDHTYSTKQCGDRGTELVDTGANTNNNNISSTINTSLTNENSYCCTCVSSCGVPLTSEDSVPQSNGDYKCGVVRGVTRLINDNSNCGLEQNDTSQINEPKMVKSEPQSNDEFSAVDIYCTDNHVDSSLTHEGVLTSHYEALTGPGQAKLKDIKTEIIKDEHCKENFGYVHSDDIPASSEFSARETVSHAEGTEPNKKLEDDIIAVEQKILYKPSLNCKKEEENIKNDTATKCEVIQNVKSEMEWTKCATSSDGDVRMFSSENDNRETATVQSSTQNKTEACLIGGYIYPIPDFKQDPYSEYNIVNVAKEEKYVAHWRKSHDTKTSVQPFEQYKCKFCGRTFPFEYSLKVHEVSHLRVTVRITHFKCRFCDKRFMLKDFLKQHEHNHSKGKPFKCKHCDFSYLKRSKLEIHTRLHTGEKTLKCHYCNKLLADSSNLRMHHKIHTGEKRFQCEKCDKCFTQSRHLDIHRGTHAGEKSFKCKVCEKSFVLTIQLRNHVLSSHSTIHTDIQSENILKCRHCDLCFTSSLKLRSHHISHTILKFPCTHCSEYFPKKYLLQKHEMAHAKDNLFRPNHCDDSIRMKENSEEQFKSEKYSKDYIAAENGQTRVVSHIRNPLKQTNNCFIKLTKLNVNHTGGKQFKCEYCNESFSQLDQLKNHEMIHTQSHSFQQTTKCFIRLSRLEISPRFINSEKGSQKESFICECCGKTFTRRSYLKLHTRIHTSEDLFKCYHCSKLFVQKASLISHMSTHTGEKPIECHSCEKCFVTKRQLKDHMRIHTEERRFKCTHCNKCFAQRYQVLIHKRIHFDVKPFECELCKKCFWTSSHLNEHRKIHTGERAYKCEICNRSFLRNGQLKTHKLTHTGERPFKCSKCGSSFALKSSLKKHNFTHNPSEKPFKCKLCGKRFTTHYHLLKRHMWIHTGKTPYNCKNCDRSFRTPHQFRIHNLTHTGGKMKYRSCEICEKQFSTKSSIILHKRVHTGEKPYKCNYCNRCFSQKINMQKHILCHSHEKSFQCKHCNKCFHHKYALKKHELRVHTADKPFKCLHCKKDFAAERTLIEHERIHTGEKPHKCGHCDKRFAGSANCRQHELIHTRKKSYKCSKCDKTFLRKTHLRLHEVVHSDAKPYKCLKCEKCFSRPESLKFHDAEHTGEKPFQCRKCKKCFRLGGTLKKHETLVCKVRPRQQ